MVGLYEYTLIQSLWFETEAKWVSKIPIALNEAVKSVQNEKNFFEDSSETTPKARLRKITDFKISTK